MLDASAVLALLNGEPGAERVASVLGRAAISAVNMAEVLARLMEHGAPAGDAVAALDWLGLAVTPLDAGLAVTVAELQGATRRRGLSLGDRACLATAIRRGDGVLTADRAWAGLDVGVEVVLIR